MAFQVEVPSGTYVAYDFYKMYNMVLTIESKYCYIVYNGEVYLQMAYNAYYTNYEIALINTWFVAKTVYPELFADIDIAEKTSEICEVFLGADIADEIFAYPSSFGGYQKIDTKEFFK